MKKLSRFDIFIIVAFVVIALVGGGVAYYLDASQLAAAQNEAQADNAEFQQYSSKMVVLPTRENLKILQGNIDLIHAQLDPMVKNYLQAPDNKLADIANENTVDWKHRLDDSVAKLNAAAKTHGIQVPDNYYYGFSSYLSRAPAEENTAVLSKQLLAIEQMVNILIGAPVDAIKSIRRTAEEEPAGSSGLGSKQGDILPGHSVEVAGGLYTAYPFEIEFSTTTGALRKVINDLMQSPYVFVIRSISVQNSRADSPQIGDLAKIAGAQSPASPSVMDSPGAVAAAKSTVGPQYLFGGETLRVQARIDFIEWKGLPSDAVNAEENPAPNPASAPKRASPTGNR